MWGRDNRRIILPVLAAFVLIASHALRSQPAEAAARLQGSTPSGYPPPGVPPVASPTAGADGRIVYVVAPGDTLSAIAFRFQVNVNDLYAYNDLTPDALLSVGQSLILGYGDNAPITPTSARFPGAIIREDGTAVHIVEAGDTLIGIAVRYGLTLEELYEVSGLNDESLLQLGQVVVVGHLPRPQESGGSTFLVEPTATPTLTPSPPATATNTPAPPTRTLPPPAATAAATPIAASEQPLLPPATDAINADGLLSIFIGVVVLLTVVGGLFMYLGRRYGA